MSDVAAWQMNPVTKSRVIQPAEKVATMGSCFAQHIAKHIASVGLNYFITETAPASLSAEEGRLNNYGVFSARYGNVYTVRQLLQLYTRAFGEFTPHETVWANGDSFVDAFRPQIQPNGFASIEEANRSTADHLKAVRAIFLESDWIVFTLGLTEAWRSKVDGSIFPIAPGISGGNYDPSRYEFVNFTLDEVRQDLFDVINKVTSLNPKVKFLLTVSPVPLMATFENRHVWVSTTYSKSVLRVCCDEAERKFNNVIYFPSFEIITSPSAGHSYYHDDLRQVTEQGVRHVMRVFSEHFIDPKQSRSNLRLAPAHSLKLRDSVVCDEEILDRI
jgi:hypothetical protein